MQPIGKGSAAWIVLWTMFASYLSMLPVMALTSISLDIASMEHVFLAVGGLAPFLAYALWRKMVVFPEAFICAAAVLASAVPILVWTYAAMKMNMPLADEALARMDAALGFDWRAFIAFVDARPRLAGMLAFAYTSFSFQLLLLPAALALAGRPVRAYAMVFAYVLVCLVSSVVGIWYPALGTYVVYGVAQGDLASINAWFGYFFLEQFHAVRADGPFLLVVNKSAGILTFPSVHAAVAAICAWAAWEAKILRYPMLALNGAMAVSAVSHANHYLVDVVAGLGLAGVCISIATLVFYRHSEGRSLVVTAVRRWASSPVAATG